jgi:hypothetical protein
MDLSGDFVAIDVGEKKNQKIKRMKIHTSVAEISRIIQLIRYNLKNLTYHSGKRHRKFRSVETSSVLIKTNL